MTQYHINPDSYSDEEIEQIKKFAFIDSKISLLLETLEVIQSLDDEKKEDLEEKISQKINRLIDKL